MTTRRSHHLPDPRASFGRIAAVVRKEFWHIARDWQTVMIVIAMPIIMMFLYGYALTMDIRELPVIIEDPARSPLGSELAARLDATTTFRVDTVVTCIADIQSVFRARHPKMILRLAPDFGRDVHTRGRRGAVQALIDGADSNVGTILRNLVEPMVRKIVLDAMHIDPPEPVKVTTRVLYNPQQKSSLYFVPGLMAMILTMISALLTSLTVTREKERGTMEQLLVSPLRPWEIIVGKLMPYIGLAAVDGTIILAVGRINFGLTVAGSLWLLAGASLVFIIASLALGLIFSTVAKTQQQAMLMTLPATVMPTVILSGFIFPIASMPVVLQWIAHILPPTYFLMIIRGIILKGVGIHELWQPICILGGIALVFLVISIKRFEVKL